MLAKTSPDIDAKYSIEFTINTRNSSQIQSTANGIINEINLSIKNSNMTHQIKRFAIEMNASSMKIVTSSYAVTATAVKVVYSTSIAPSTSPNQSTDVAPLTFISSLGMLAIILISIGAFIFVCFVVTLAYCSCTTYDNEAMRKKSSRISLSQSDDLENWVPRKKVPSARIELGSVYEGNRASESLWATRKDGQLYVQKLEEMHVPKKIEPRDIFEYNDDDEEW